MQTFHPTKMRASQDIKLNTFYITLVLYRTNLI